MATEEDLLRDQGEATIDPPKTRNVVTVSRCRVAGIEAVVADSVHAFGRHSHDQFGIGVLFRGAQRSASGRGPVEAEAGDLITVNPGEVHDGLPVDAAGRAWRMLYFDPAIIAGRVASLSEGRAGEAELAFPVRRDPRLAARFAMLFRSLVPSGDTAEVLAAEENLLLLLAGLTEGIAPAHKPQPTRAIALARAHIDEDPAAPLTLEDLTHITGISPFRLVRGFARETGLSPHAYLVQRRLQRARRLIGAGLSLAEAALAAGFADQSHMTRLFARAYGFSPGVYAAACR